MSVAILQQGFPANGRPCVACRATGRILLAGAYFHKDSNGTPTAGPFYRVRCADTGGGMWPTPEYDEPCQHCSGTGVMGPNGESVHVAPGPRGGERR